MAKRKTYYKKKAVLKAIGRYHRITVSRKYQKKEK